MRHEVVRVVHVAALLDADEVLGRVDALAAAGAGQKHLHRHVLLQRHAGRLEQRVEKTKKKPSSTVHL